MKKYIALAALLLVTGCSVNDTPINKQSVREQTRIMTPASNAVPAPIVTKSSSIATTGARKSSVSMKQNSFTFPDWFLGGQGQGQGQSPTSPAQPAPNQNPAKQAPSSSSSQFEQQVLQLVNTQRANAGLSKLGMDDKLANMAMVKAQDMIKNNYFSHTSPTYGSPFDMMRQFQITYKAAGENIAKGQSSAEQVMNDWMNSPGHRANILSGSFTKIGIAYYNGAWVQEFIG